ncbi:MAG TPA: hypothetical protein VK140_16445 [Ktedonobacteraceae bacterium]|nr:hypothetical protein [Ktedonobacteraceae bacterium]
MTRRGGRGEDGWWGRLRRPGVGLMPSGRGRRKRPHTTQPHPRPYEKTPPLVKLVRVGDGLSSPC